MEFERGKRISQHLDIAPLIDIVFLLLIFFMLTANFIMQHGIKITLPQAKTSQPQEEMVVVFISEDNKIYLNEKHLGIELLEDALKVKLQEIEKKIVVIKADEKIDLGLAVKVMDIAKASGADGLTISTEKNGGK
ncbi:biopolymer transporter ExbD [Candidatus Desantisbacteria bacterium CG_4_9_14_3_um_filter_40_11]|uniref:Biopolymer transporter ExbD n=3 Tax=unclassified Candidatus Desantisiibacteriota TaxID=3106372 RepID=A0A2M7J864_9BACT|nr:MAG: biopolymer transporter ExbD [Candidatus Desantisbacteria bacterium CG_4_8_14_3_um_filter_40_12]PIY19330.1 MAG: biopolymer transporter ExbD [Candidatus Desantisbacteria bacterium CG_4_10_14_3_um_filter_40_18]PJB29097.1 MAG: biopolymer transporter ExbD [Candidatus Desantisbacteria bacterium CG_4_9_14_3_um_filter_40_11]